MKRFKVILFLVVIMSTNCFSQNVDSINNDTAIIDTTDIVEQDFKEWSEKYPATVDSIKALYFTLYEEAIFYYNDYNGNYQIFKNSYKRDIKHIWITYLIKYYSYPDNVSYSTIRYDNIPSGYNYENEPFSEALKEGIYDIEPFELAKVQWKDGTYSTIKLFFIKKEYLWTLQ